jgi:ATP-dependent DNA helicase HFM1/MER3
MGTRANSYKIDESCRPVQLKKIVLGYPCPDRMSDFIFDLRLNYRLHEVIQNYSNGKPTLIVTFL